MVNANFPKRQAHQSVVGVSLLAVAIATLPGPIQAQLPLQPGIGPSQLNPSPGRRSPDSYKLGGGDRIQLEILEVPDLSRNYEVLSDGSINLPLVGLVSLRGLTLVEATATIRNALRRLLKDPIVSVSLVAARPLNIGVIGEVNRPGNFIIPLTPGPGVAPSVQYPTVIQALRVAEGITGVADVRSIQVRRPQPDGPPQLLTVNLWAFLQEGDSSQDIILQDRDTVIVPTVTNFNQAEARQIAIANFSPSPEQPRSVTVVGEVIRPGSYVVIGGNTTNSERTVGFPTVTRAIQLAGGITSLADIRQIQVRRPTRAGEQIISVNLWQFLETGDSSQDTILQQGDTVIIPRATLVNPAEARTLATTNFSAANITIYIVGEVRTPADPIRLPSNATLNQALLSRGFFGYENGRAKRDEVDLIRRNDDGTTTKRTIKVDLSQGTNDEINPMLRDNDIIVVSRSNLAQWSDRVNSLAEPAARLYPFFNLILLLRNLYGIF